MLDYAKLHTLRLLVCFARFIISSYTQFFAIQTTCFQSLTEITRHCTSLGIEVSVLFQ